MKCMKFRLALPVSILKCTVKQKMYFTTLVYTVNQNNAITLSTYFKIKSERNYVIK